MPGHRVAMLFHSAGLSFFFPHTPLFVSRIRSLIRHPFDRVLLCYPDQITDFWPFTMKFQFISVEPRAKWIDAASPENAAGGKG